MRDNIPVNETVSLLEDFFPNKLLVLKKKHPDKKDLFISGQTLGENEMDLLKIKMEISHSGNNGILEKCKELLPKVKRRLEKISKLQFASQLLVIIAGATIISILQEEGLDWLKYLSSSLILIGSIINLYIQHISNSVYNDSSMFQIFNTLSDNYIKAEQLQNELELFMRLEQLQDEQQNEAIEIVKNVNATSLELRKIINHL